ncbi:MAG: ferredoxin family protein [Anaerolineaceae bacterium]|nr:ferredoxin family protein [Anaerolineaceae bacterium]
MTHVITSLCLRDAGCVVQCPVACIVPGNPQDEWPQFYIDPNTCIDCGACVPECPYGAIFPLKEVPQDFIAIGGEVLNGTKDMPGYDTEHDCSTYDGNPVHLNHCKILLEEEHVDLSDSIARNREFFETGPGYLAIDL